MAHLSIARLFDDNREKLKLAWIAGRHGGTKSLSSDLIKDAAKGLIGHLNFIHPNWIQVLGSTEVEYLKSKEPHVCRAILSDIATRGLACFMLAGRDEIPPALAAVAEDTETAVFASPAGGFPRSP